MMPGPTADMILVGARIRTTDDRPAGDVVAIRDKGIVYVGERTGAPWNELVGSGTDVVDVAGRTVIPGLIDGHTHPEMVALSSLHISLPRADELDTILDFLHRYAADHPVAEVPFIYAEYYPSDMHW